MRMLRKLLRKSLTARRLLRAIRLRRLPSVWESIAWTIPWSTATEPRCRVLMATSMGAHLPGVALESLLGEALRLRQAEVEYLLCNGVLPACQECTMNITIREKELAEKGPQARLCHDCFRYPAEMLSRQRFKVNTYSQWLTEEDRRTVAALAREIPRESIETFRWKGTAVGEHAAAGALRFYARGSLEGVESFEERILRRYLEAALLTVIAVERLLDAGRFDVAVFHHGIYVPQGLIGEVCRRKGVRVVNWNPAYRKKSFIFSHGNTYHRTMMEEPVENWETLPWTEAMEERLKKYLHSRKLGSEDWIWFHQHAEEDMKNLERRFGIDFSKPCVALLTSVTWDACLHYPVSLYPRMTEWIFDTIRYFMKRPDLQLILRIHPAEVTGGNPSRERVMDVIRRQFPELPPNIFLIPPQDPASTYAVAAACNAVLIYNTKAGIEIASLGIPVIVAGEAWVRGKGFTRDPRTREEYLAMLAELPYEKKMTGEEVLRARRYAYHFFFRRMIPFRLVRPVKSWPLFRYDFADRAELLPEKDAGLDVICDGILEGREFIFPAEKTYTDAVRVSEVKTLVES